MRRTKPTARKRPPVTASVPPYLENVQPFHHVAEELVKAAFVDGRVAAWGRRDTDTKASNPKEAFGELKMVDGLVPETAIIEENLAFLEGALKYGQYNWRVAGVKASTYRRAIGRHLKKWWNGQDRDPVTMVKELASVRACCGIMLDAIACGKFTDDRPPRADIERTLTEAAKIAAHLKELFKDHHPPQYTQVQQDMIAQQAALANAAMPVAYRHTGIVPAGTLPEPGSHRRKIVNLLRKHRKALKAERAKKRNPTSRKKLMAAIRKGRKPRGRDIPYDAGGEPLG